MSRDAIARAENQKKAPGSPSDIHRHILDVPRAVLGLVSAGGWRGLSKTQPQLVHKKGAQASIAALAHAKESLS